jgi:hypothetical protein
MITLDDLRRFGNLPEHARELLRRVGEVVLDESTFGSVPRRMASQSLYETALDKQYLEAEHALLGLVLADDLPLRIWLRDKPDLDVLYSNGTYGGVEVARCMYELLARADSDNAVVERTIKEAISSSRDRSTAMVGRNIFVIIGAAGPLGNRRRQIVAQVLQWIDAELPLIIDGACHVDMPPANGCDDSPRVTLRLGSLAGTRWELTVCSVAEDVVPMLSLESRVSSILCAKRRKAQEYRYITNVTLVIPMTGFHPDALIADELRALSHAALEITPFVRVVVYRDFETAVLLPQ